MNRKHTRTLGDIFTKPTRANLRFDDVVGLVSALGGTVTQRAGSRVAFILSGKVLVLHRSHPSPVMDKGAVEDMRVFLSLCGINP